MFDYNFDFDLGEYAPDKMLEYGLECGNEFNKMVANSHHSYLAMFKRQIEDAGKIRPENRQIVIDAIIASCNGLIGVDTKQYVDRMKTVDLTDWTSAKTKLVGIIDELDKKIEA